MRQYKLRWIGPFIGVLYLTAPLIGTVGYVMTAVTLYTVTLPYTKSLVPWLTLPTFLIIAFAMGVFGLFLFYKFVFPSYYAFITKEQYIHDNPMQRDLALIKKKLGIEEDNN